MGWKCWWRASARSSASPTDSLRRAARRQVNQEDMSMKQGSFRWLGGVGAAAAGLVIAACIVQQEPAPGGLPANQTGGGPPGAEVAGAGGLANGEYSCSIADSGYQYPPFRCVVYSGEDGGQVLEKMGGSQRFRGRVLQDGGDGFRFDGTFYCPQGDCTENVSGSF